LLLHAFNDKNFILPDKQGYQAKKKAAANAAAKKSVANRTMKSTQVKEELDEDTMLSK
jgi:hypothetical protein